MLLSIDHTYTIPFATEQVLIHNKDNTADLVYLDPNGNLVRGITTTPFGEWADRVFALAERVSLEQGVTKMVAKEVTDELTVFVWLSDERHRIAMIPDTSPLYSPKTPYRLYYGVDSEKLYQNIADTWQYIATKNHLNLTNAGKYTHEEIDDKLDALALQIAQLLQ